ncbi:unnamed protein product [Dovyalis caffra]|uniref:Uncharacterized protein n=1 Tax=Dovyalis caffra TaxID=77055 RepID=A0AAV1R427_9ROSI|nr:unnamed protein product [Dovyalis caffra]
MSSRGFTLTYTYHTNKRRAPTPTTKKTTSSSSTGRQTRKRREISERRSIRVSKGERGSQ